MRSTNTHLFPDERDDVTVEVVQHNRGEMDPSTVLRVVFGSDVVATTFLYTQGVGQLTSCALSLMNAGEKLMTIAQEMATEEAVT